MILTILFMIFGVCAASGGINLVIAALEGGGWILIPQAIGCLGAALACMYEALAIHQDIHGYEGDRS